MKEEDATEANAVCDAETTCTERCRTKGAQRPRARGERAPAEPRPHYCPYLPAAENTKAETATGEAPPTRRRGEPVK